jgi:hypothetical protein
MGSFVPGGRLSALVFYTWKLHFQRVKGSKWFKVSDIMTLHFERKLISMDLFDTVIRFEIPMRPSAAGVELSVADIFLGVDLEKAKRTGMELVVQSAELGKNGI